MAVVPFVVRFSARCDARYPLAIFHGHFPHDFGGFRETPPDPDIEPEYSERFDWPAYSRTEQEYAYQLYKDWTGPDFPRMIIEDFLEGTTDPYYGGGIDYGDRAEHCWNGDHTRPNATSRLRYHQMFAPRIVERILKTAPSGADVTSWRH